MLCLICGDDLNKGELIMVKEKGIKTFKKFSELRNDGLVHLFQGLEEVAVHNHCRRKYTKEKYNGKYKPFPRIPMNVEVPTASDFGIGTYPFKLICFFCNTQAREDQDIRVITNENTKETILKAIAATPCKKNDSIMKRIDNVDLKKEEARYHKKCYFDCLRPRQGLKRGRLEEDDVITAMETIYQYMEESSNTQFTMGELKGVLNEYIPEQNTILKKLKKRFATRISIVEQAYDTVISFKVDPDNANTEGNGLGNADLNLELSIEKELDEETLSIIKKAAEILKEDVASKVFKDLVGNPSPQFFLTQAKHNLPRSLELFLKTLSGRHADKDEIQIAAAANLLLVYRSL